MHRWPLRVLTIAAAALLAACSHADRSTAQGSAADTNGGSASAGSWAHSDTALSRLRVHSGFSIHLFASGLHDPRMMAFGPDSALYVSEPTKGTVMRLVDVDGDGHADSTMTAVSGLNRPHGVAWHGDTLWIGNTDAVVIAWSTKHDGTLDGLHT
ncbi:MAG TPA: hypothetical protein VFW98_10045, partial [Gemmatimonadaceae bacterium]|nr:hypothetical protein [Gemmatimonadaceae bacterium]